MGKKRFGRDWGRKVWLLLVKLVRMVMAYGVEIWGWKEKEGIDRLGIRYLRWLLGMNRRTPEYMIREKLQREKLWERAGKRAWEFEKRLEEG